MKYIPVTTEQNDEIQKVLGFKNTEELMKKITNEKFILTRNLNIEGPLSEIEITKKMSDISSKNTALNEKIPFIGEIAYNHYIPSIVKHLAMQSQFYTSYTPYQPELSQGTLEAIYEYQSYMVNLTGMDVSNASLYDGATAAAEAMYMLTAATDKCKVLISSLIHPSVKEVLKTYAHTAEIGLIEVINDNGNISYPDLEEKLSDEIACFIFQSPNAFGVIEDISALVDILSKKRIKMISVILEAMSLGIMKPPGTMGVDIVCGEAQSFGNDISFGGPGLGFITCKKENIRRLPGRIVGKTLDTEGRVSYVLTLRAREQDIRREKATSNICTNNSLCALKASIYLSTLGEEGLREVAEQNLQLSHYAFNELNKISKINVPYKKPFFNEFLIETPIEPEKLSKILLEKGILISNSPLSKFYPYLKNPLILTFTELTTKNDIDYLVRTLKEVL